MNTHINIMSHLCNTDEANDNKSKKHVCTQFNNIYINIYKKIYTVQKYIKIYFCLNNKRNKKKLNDIFLKGSF